MKAQPLDKKRVHRKRHARQKHTPWKLRAREAVRRALASGKLVRPPACEECGTSCKPHGHHEDYKRPLVVVWLCTACHYRRHRTVH